MSKAKVKPLEFPRTDKPFDKGFRGLMGHLAIPDPDSTITTNSWTRLGIDAATIYNPLVAFLGATGTNNTWLHVFPLQESKTTRNATTKLQKNTLKKECLSLIHSERKILKAQEHLTPGFLTANDKLFWFIPEANPRTSTMETLRIAHPIPALSIFKRLHLQNIVDFHDIDNITSRALPDGIILFELFKYTGTVPPTDPSQFKHVLFSTHFRNLVNVPVSEAKLDTWY
ncbi:MAG: hypothetical protein ACYDCN_11875, partial [Bacteroidia bacterium]